jgi:tRNA pseudouridine55 synthase
MTAHDVVNRLRRLTGIKQVGHAGTLDPLARGVLPIALGRACRLLRFLADDKVYLATILFGQRTDTDDLEGTVIATSKQIPMPNEIAAVLKKFLGKIEQIPPLFSAIHLHGHRLYELARRGEIPGEIPSRKVQVYAIEQLDYQRGSRTPSPEKSESKSQSETESEIKSETETEAEIETGTDSHDVCQAESARLNLRIHCSTGTYIRSLARDLGEELGSAACLAALERERAGFFEIGKSCRLEKLQELAAQGALASVIEPPENCLPQPSVDLSPVLSKKLAAGQRLSIKSDCLKEQTASSKPDSARKPEYVLALCNGRLTAVCSLINSGPAGANEFSEGEESSIVELKPEVVFADGSFF